MKKTVISILVAVTLLFSGSLLFAESSDLPSSFKYPIRRGTTLSRIAKDFGVSQKALIEANQNNPSFKSPNKILAGGKLNIPRLYTQTDVSNIRASDKRITDGIAQAIAKDATAYKAESSNKSVVITLLTIAGAFVVFFWIKYLIKYWDEKTLLEETKDSLSKAEKDLRELQLSDAEKGQIIKSLKINLQVGQEQVSALEQAKKEAENLRNEHVSTLNKLEELSKEADRIRLERGVLFVELAAAAYMPRFKTQSGQYITFYTVKVRCKFKDCNTEVSPQNALSHYFQQHGHTKESEPKETVDNEHDNA